LLVVWQWGRDRHRGAYYAMKRARTTPDRVLFVAVAALIAGDHALVDAVLPGAGPERRSELHLLPDDVRGDRDRVGRQRLPPDRLTKQELQFAIAVPALGGIGAGALGAARAA